MESPPPFQKKLNKTKSQPLSPGHEWSKINGFSDISQIQNRTVT